MLYHGVGIEKDVAAANVYFEKAAWLGNVHASICWANLPLGEDISKDIEAAMK